MAILAAFIVGALLGWVVSWVLQKRLDDNLTDEVAQLKRQIAEYQRETSAMHMSAVPENAASPVASSETTAPVAPVDSAGQATATIEGPAGESQDEPAARVAAVSVAEPDAGETATSEEKAIVTEQAEVEVVESEAPVSEDAESMTAETVVAVAEGDVEETAEAAAPEHEEVPEPEPQAEELQPASPSPVGRPDGADDFTKMRGVGPKFSEALYAAGITTFDQVANMTPEQLQEVVQAAAWQKVDFDEWIEQASELSQQDA